MKAKRILSVGLILIFIFSCAFTVVAGQLEEAQQRKNEIESKLKDVAQEKKELEAEKKRLEEDKKNLLNAQAQETKEYEKLVEELNKLEEELAKIEDSIRQAEKDLEEKTEQVKIRLRVMYESSKSSILYSLINSKSLTDFFEKIELISFIAKKDSEMIEELKFMKADVEYMRQLKAQEIEGVENKKVETRERLDNLTASRAEIEQRLNQRLQDLKRIEQLEDQLLEESRKADKEIAALLSNNPYVGGSMVWPAPGNYRVTSQYGMRFHPILKVNRMHSGIDIDADTGDDIVAANDGTVILSGTTSGYGKRIVIDHGGGISTLYAHCSKLLVSVGDKVKAGQVIAKVGSTGLSTGPHLHFEVRENDKTVDPLKGYLSK
ncbi:MAG TPA: peptidoglycan DD-metalloendopeptidase family protein [Clostridiaceae bacterium]|nr:peptidoglycan DD-metalloendopeptidase family protein [Clostridiaceae bacterium]